jgi:hypothetical protein
MQCTPGNISGLWQDETLGSTTVYPVQLLFDHVDARGCPQGIVALYDKTVSLEDIQAALNDDYGRWAKANNAGLPVKLWRVESEKFAIQLAIVGEHGNERPRVRQTVEGRSKQTAIAEAGMKEVIYLSFAVSEGVERQKTGDIHDK